MSETTEQVNPLERKTTVTVAWEAVNAETDRRLKQTARRVRIDGFRPGKAPLKMVASMYGAGIQNDVLNDAVREAFEEAVKGENLRVAALTGIEPVENQENADSFQAVCVYEVYPEIKVGDLSALEIEKTSAEVGDAEVDKTIDILRKQRTRYNRVERAAQNDDRVIIDFAGTIDGIPFEGGSAKNYPFILGQGQMLPEFEAGVSGLKEGESKDVEVKFPDDYHGKDVAGKTAVFAITLHNVAEPVLPEVDEQFARALGIEDGDTVKMREEVRKNVAREVKRRVDGKNRDAVMAALRQSHEFPLPQVLVNEEAARLAEDMKKNLASQGMDPAQLNLPAEMFAERAAERVALGLLLPVIVEENKLHASDEQIRALVLVFAESYEDPEEVAEWYFADRNRLSGVANLALENNVVEFVLGKAKTTEKSLSFDEIMAAA